MTDLNDLFGFWKVLECIPMAINVDTKGIQGTVFQLTKTGDVIWKLPSNSVPSPIFMCDTYEILMKRDSPTNFLMRFGVYKGHLLNCSIELCKRYAGIIFIEDGWCLLVCKKFEKFYEEFPSELPFSFLPALQGGYFSDLVIRANNSKEFHVHSCILKLGAPELDWLSNPPPLSNLSEDVISTILHYLYAQCLPSRLQEDTVKMVISTASEMPGLEQLVELCHINLKNIAFKNQIYNLISDMHACASRIIEHFSDKITCLTEDVGNFTFDPAKFCFAIKNCIREAAVAGAKLMVLCDVFAKQKTELSREEADDVVLYVKSRIPVFMNQLERFLQAVQTSFSNLLPSQRQELASYLVPEVETIVDTISSLLIKIKTSLELVLLKYETEVKEKFSPNKKCERVMEVTDKVLHIKDLNRLRCIIHKISCGVVHVQQKKENFKMMTTVNKNRSMSRNLEQIIEELPIFLLRAEEFSSDFDEILQQNESQFHFKVCASKVSEIIKNLILHKECLQDSLSQLCDLIQRDVFSHCLTSLNLLDSSNNRTAVSEISEKYPTGLKTPASHCNWTDSISISPPAHRSRLSKAAGELLKSKKETDMTFEIVTSKETDNVIDSTGELFVETGMNVQQEVYRIEAHRVIVAARCDWFRRALLSGMQEDIHRKVVVHNTSPHLFSLFLEFLYSGRLDYSSLSVDQIFELLFLGDKYELDSLKEVCESNLKSHLHKDSVLYFISLADRFNANILKSACERFIAQHPEVMDSDLFEELPQNLQSEIYDVVICEKPLNIDPILCEKLSANHYNVSAIEEMAANVHLNSNRNLPSTDSDDISIFPDF